MPIVLGRYCVCQVCEDRCSHSADVSSLSVCSLLPVLAQLEHDCWSIMTYAIVGLCIDIAR